MIAYTSGDLLASDAQVLVNPVNCVGVMGKGLAKAFADRFPTILPPYQAACRERRLRPGQVQFLTLPDGRVIANLPTKDHWRDPSRIEWVRDGLAALRLKVLDRGLSSIAIPPLGAGLGGLRWRDVRSEIEHAFVDDFDLDVRVYEPR